jgi:hypothetical protein
MIFDSKHKITDFFEGSPFEPLHWYETCYLVDGFWFMGDIETTKNVLIDMKERSETLVVPDFVEVLSAIGAEGGVFEDDDVVRKIVLPDSVTWIGDSAFRNCVNLEEVTIPDSVERIDEGAFYGCSKLKKIRIPDGVAKISEYVFYGCVNLEEITIPDSVTKIGDGAFGCCDKLPAAVRERIFRINEQAF